MLIKRSITLSGHRTSLALEAEFWQALQTIAAQKGLSLPALVTTIDRQRQNSNLSSAIRVYVLRHFLPGSADSQGPDIS